MLNISLCFNSCLVAQLDVNRDNLIRKSIHHEFSLASHSLPPSSRLANPDCTISVPVKRASFSPFPSAPLCPLQPQLKGTLTHHSFRTTFTPQRLFSKNTNQIPSFPFSKPSMIIINKLLRLCK